MLQQNLLIRVYLSVVLICLCDGFRCLHPKLTNRINLRMSTRSLDQTIVVTGLGIISPAGNSASTFFDSICSGVSSVDKMTRFDCSNYKCQIAAQVNSFDPKDHYRAKKKVKQNDLSCHYAVAASHMALSDAGLNDLGKIDATRVGTIIGTAFGGMDSFEKAVLELDKNGPASINPYTIPMILGNTPAGIVGMETGAKGPNFGLQTACATATHAFGEAIRLLRNGDADVMIAGGTEAPLTPLSFAGFSNLMAMNFNFNDNPKKASRPFDLHRGGFIMSEGAGVLILETLAHAIKRGARVYCELAGYGASCDAYHITSPDPEGQGLKRAVLACLKDSQIDKEEVQYINAHGTSTKKNDLFETIAFKDIFGEQHARKLSISSIKGSTGHALGAAGGFEGIACVKAIETGIIPPTINYETPDPECDLDYTVNQPKKVDDLRVAISDNLGFGGHNGVVAFRKIQ